MRTFDCTKDAPWEEMVRQAQHEEVLLVRDGHAVALVIPFDDDLDWYSRERDPAFLDSLARARRQVREDKTVVHRELKRRLGIDTSAGGGS
jgi:hypothetical protein